MDYFGGIKEYNTRDQGTIVNCINVSDKIKGRYYGPIIGDYAWDIIFTGRRPYKDVSNSHRQHEPS